MMGQGSRVLLTSHFPPGSEGLAAGGTAPYLGALPSLALSL